MYIHTLLMTLLILVVFVLFIFLIFYMLNFFFSLKEFYFNKISSFECGFLSVGKVQNSFSVHFFIMMLMFVIFDLEVVMFLGVLMSDFYSLFSVLFLFFFILGGFYMEWWYGKLVWLI